MIVQNRTALFFLLVAGVLISCRDQRPSSPDKAPGPCHRLELTFVQAGQLAGLPLSCIDTQYPNKPGQVLAGDDELLTPKEMHPAFYGCFDWHSSVHGHWSLVWLVKNFPELADRNKIIEKLQEHISAENILTEVRYFQKPHEKTYERTYGWAWLLKLAEELHTWEDPVARKLEASLQPLTDHIMEAYLSFLPKLVYPVRVGTHANTAFGLSLAWDYADLTGHDSLKAMISEKAREFFLDDMNCPLSWEPGGFDFLSPCLQEADIMRKILPEEEFRSWLKSFLPELSAKDFNLEPGLVSDRTDGHLVHLDGVNFSRAWCLYGIAATLPEYSHLIPIANAHVSHSLPNIVDDSYEGGHWLGTFAIYALRAN
jgi:hypothetical protein